MRPLRLTMRAFGPYAQEQTIDFEELGARTLFLIHGPTGAGKTTILDALCFALFGKSSGGEREAVDLRSDHADKALLTEVTLDFRLGEERYRIRRAPKQERAAKRGQGTTTEEATATLWRRPADPSDDAEGHVLAVKPGLVTGEIKRLLGFGEEHFRQVVVLPQGAFRQLLTAASDQREEILKTLFRTQFLQKIEYALKDAAATIGKQQAEHRERRKTLLKQAELENDEEVAARAAALSERVEELERAASTLSESERAARAAVEAARATVRAIEEREAAEAALTALRAESAARDWERTMLERARRADTLRDVVRVREARKSEAAVAAQRAAEAAQGLKAAQTARESAASALAGERARDGERAQVHHRLERLKAVEPALAALEQAAAEVAAAKKTCVEGEAARARLDAEWEKVEAARSTLTQRIEAAAQVAARVEALTLAENRAAALVQRAARLTAAQAKLGATRGLLAEAKRAFDQNAVQYKAATDRLEQLERGWRLQQAATLAAALKDGEACVVCGSLEHPEPAHRASALPVPEKTLSAQRQTVKEVEAAREKVAAILASHREDEVRALVAIEDLAHELGEDASRKVSELESAARAAAAEVETARQAGAVESRLRAELAAQDEGREKYKEALARRDDEARQARERLAAAEAVLREREKALPEELRDRVRVQRDIDEAARLEAALAEALAHALMQDTATAQALAAAEEAAKAAGEAANEAAARAAEAASDCAERLQSAAFETEAEYAAALLEPGASARLAEGLARFDAALKAAEERTTRAQDAAKDNDKPDVAALDAAHAACQAALLARSTELGAAHTTLRSLRALEKSLASIAEELVGLESRYGIVGRLAELAVGRNMHKVSFHTFVLGALLDDVLAAATQRLRRMSRGRYDLQRRGYVKDLRVNTGLDLEVFDAHTGEARAAHTLSGGESFLAAMALALGLSDVVQAYAGGVRLDCLFIDEGFGSLDPEALDLAFATLMDLQEGGRLVGVISHVAELRERIDARLEVSSGRDGSSARFVL